MSESAAATAVLSKHTRAEMTTADEVPARPAALGVIAALRAAQHQNHGYLTAR